MCLYKLSTYRLTAIVAAGGVALLAGCAASQTHNGSAADSADTHVAATKPAAGSLDYDKNLWHQLLADNTKIRRVVRHNAKGVEAVTESDDPAMAAKIIEHAKAMQTRMKSGARVRVWDQVFAEMFDKHDVIDITVTPTDKGVKIVESSDDAAAIALLRSHAMGVSTFVREGFSVSPNETARFKAGDPIPVGEVAIGGVRHRILLEQPDAAQLSALKAAGVSSVVNFRKPSEHAEYNEQGAATAAGLGYCNLPYKGDAELTDDVIDSARAALKTADGKGQAIVLHCRTGNRAGPGWAAYRALDKHVPLEQAIAEAKAMQMADPAMENKTRDYIRRHVGEMSK